MPYDEWGEPVAGGLDEWGETAEQRAGYKKKKPGFLREVMDGLTKDYKKKFMLRLGIEPKGGMTEKDEQYVKAQREAAGLAAAFRQKQQEADQKRIATIASSMKPAIQSPNYSYNFSAPQFGGR